MPAIAEHEVVDAELRPDDLAQRIGDLERAVNELAGADGTVCEAKSAQPSVSVGGRFDFDNGWYRVPQNIQDSLDTPLLDGTAFRRFRLGCYGWIGDQLEYKLEADFSKAADFKSFQTTPQTNIFITHAWVALHDLPLIDTLRIGHQKEYFTFANATSSNFIPFMERPYIYDAFENNFAYDNGISINRGYFEDRVTTWLGAFWNGTHGQAFNVGGHYGVSGRLTWMPIYSEDEKRWLNLAVSGSSRALNSNDPNDLTVRPLVRTGQNFNVPDLIRSGGLFGPDGLQIAGAGVHAARGPWTVGSEFLCWKIDDAFTGGLPNPDGTLPAGVEPVGNLLFSGCYVELLRFLTPGDHRPVERVIPGYDRIRPAGISYAFEMPAASASGDRVPGKWASATTTSTPTADRSRPARWILLPGA